LSIHFAQNWYALNISVLLEEEDIFESDFESTDEETAQQEGESGERIVEDEEKQARKVCLPAFFLISIP
jgi:hypothetical protein